MMHKIFLTGSVTKDLGTFRQELQQVEKDWEQNYSIRLMFILDDIVQIELTHTDGYESRQTLSTDANTIADYLEQWTEFVTQSINIC